jgi:hypothetical protein
MYYIVIYIFLLMTSSDLIKLNTRGTKKWRVSVPARLSELSFGGATFENFCVLSCVNLIPYKTIKYY